jgi:hypothetical protein
MKIIELLEAAPQMNLRYAPQQGVQGKPLDLTPLQVQQIVKANKLTTTPQAQQAVGKGAVPMPVVTKTGTGFQVVSGGDILASLANSPSKVRVMIQDPQQAAQQQQVQQAQLQAPAQGQGTAQATMAAAQASQQNKPKGPGIATQVKRGFAAGQSAASSIGYKISNIAGKLGAR